MTQSPERTTYPRFSAAQRLEHLVLLVAFIGLALTGLPQKFTDQTWARFLLQAEGGIESARILHRFLAILLIVEAMYHVGVVAYRLFVLRQQATMLPGLHDLRDLRDSVLFNVGLKHERPRMPHFNFRNKLEYWLVMLSLAILIYTGFMLWNPIAATLAMPGDVIPAARLIHGNQALLTVLIVAVWHLYNVLIRQVNFSIFTGRLSRKAMREEHAEELAHLDGPTHAPVVNTSSRKRIFWPIAIVIAIVMITALVRFVTFEQTAITTVPRQTVSIYAPNIRPTAGDAHVGAALWQTLRCAFCHGPEAQGGINGVPALQGTPLTFDQFYQQVRHGSEKMPAFQQAELPDAYLSHLWAWLMAQSTF
jgi:formate dehydrogenase gamma subunit